MPISFDPRWIVGLDVMNRLEFLRQLNADFTLTAYGVKCFANLILAARTMLEEINVPDLTTFRKRIIGFLGGTSDYFFA